jgi:hypothetical protein
MRQTNDQQAATEALRAQAGPYRVTLDAEGWPMIEGRYGQIEQHDGALLAVYSRAMRKLAPLVAFGARRHQVGDDEYRLLFDPALLGDVARTIRARRRQTARQGNVAALARAQAARRAVLGVAQNATTVSQDGRCAR